MSDQTQPSATDEPKIPGPISLSKIEITKVVDIIGTKQTQYYALWAVYTAVQFSAANFGGEHGASPVVAAAVLVGFWAFNIGHLGFVLQCARQLHAFSRTLEAALRGDHEGYVASLRSALTNYDTGGFFFRFRDDETGDHRYFWNKFVHLLIDACASTSLVLRAHDAWIARKLCLALGCPWQGTMMLQ